MVKRADATTFEHVLSEASRLEPADQLRLLEGLAILVRRQLDSPLLHSIKELRGLGKATWQGSDAQAYVDQERSAWDG